MGYEKSISVFRPADLPMKSLRFQHQALGTPENTATSSQKACISFVQVSLQNSVIG